MMTPPEASKVATAEEPRPSLLEDTADAERRRATREALCTLSRDAGRLRAQLAELLIEVQDRRYWSDWKYRSFRSYVEKECGLSFRTAQVYMKCLRSFRALGVAAARLCSLEWSKAELVSRVIGPHNAAELLRAMEELPYAKLREKVRNSRRASAQSEDSPGHHPSTDAALALASDIDNAASDVPHPGGWRLPLPPVDQFLVEPEVWGQICWSVFKGKNALLIGPSGFGKTELCLLAAAAAGRPVEVFYCGSMSEPRSTLIGNTHFDKGRGTWFAESRFVRAIRVPGTVVVLDEITRAPREAFNIFLSLMDRQRALALDESEDATVVLRGPQVAFLATANIGMEYTGADQLDWALLGRFAPVIHLEYPSKLAELSLVRDRCPGLDAHSASRLASLAARQRELARDGEFMGTVSTRNLLEAGEQVADGVPFDSAVKHCILNRFSAEGGEASERAKLLQILQKDRG